jgi:outer membrane receptor for monomeric catechols
MPLVLAPAARGASTGGGNSRYSSAGGQGASCSSISSESSHSSGDSLASSSSSRKSRRQPGDLAQEIARLQAMHDDVMAELQVFKSG